MSDANEFEAIDELLRLVDEPLPMRDDHEDKLLGQLLADLAKGPLDAHAQASVSVGDVVSHSSDDDALVISLADRSTTRRQRSSRLVAVGAALVAAALILFVLFLSPGNDSTLRVADDPSASTVITTTTGPVPVTSVEDACAAFASRAPDRLTLRAAIEDGTADVPALDQLLIAFDELIEELERRDDVVVGLEQVSLARGSAQQARANLAAGLDSASAFNRADDGLRLLQLDDVRFQECWRF